MRREPNLLGVIVNKVDINEYKRYRRSFDYFKKGKICRSCQGSYEGKQEK